MRNQLRRFALTAGLTAALGTMSLMAQMTKAGNAEIPFDFQIQDQVLPAGSYTVDETSTTGLIVVRNDDTRKAVLALAPVRTSGKEDGPKLVFHRYGDRYFLSEIWLTGEDAGHMIRPGKLEKELASGPARGTGILATIHLK